MGKLILCHHKKAKIPYHFEITNTNIYSIEELSYYLYHNIYAIHEGVFGMVFVSWIREELDLPEVADKLSVLINNHNSLKDIVVTLLCSSDYCSEEEINEVIQIINDIDHLEPIRKQKIKADHYLKYKRFQAAQKEYFNILNAKEAKILSEQEYGDILHNIAVIKLHTTSYMEAASTFKEAYSYNQEEETLKEYFLALKFSKCEKEYEKAINDYQLSPDLLIEINRETKNTLLELEESSALSIIKKLKKYKEDGKLSEFYKGLDAMIYECKNEYRKF